MLKVIYIEFDGIKYEVDVVNGLSVMEGVVKNMVFGIDVDCGGVCVCVICYVYVDLDWKDKMGELNEMEMSMFDFVEEVKDNSCFFC